jgi:uncharacterized protein (TIGR02453 family)
VRTLAAHFGSGLFDFLFDLDVHNERAWFDANRGRYELEVRAPMLAFITDIAAPLRRRVSRHLVADPRKQGGSMFRIHRDTRFSNDASPYKTWAACQFRHELGRDVHAPGYYLHLEPGNVFAGAGIWHPDSAALAAIRERIDGDQVAWKRVRNARWLGEGGWEFTGDAVKTAPRGYDRDHPLIEDLRRKDVIVVKAFDERDVTSPDFLDAYLEACVEAKPLMRFLCTALAVPF